MFYHELLLEIYRIIPLTEIILLHYAFCESTLAPCYFLSHLDSRFITSTSLPKKIPFEVEDVIAIVTVSVTRV